MGGEHGRGAWEGMWEGSMGGNVGGEYGRGAWEGSMGEEHGSWVWERGCTMFTKYSSCLCYITSPVVLG